MPNASVAPRRCTCNGLPERGAQVGEPFVVSPMGPCCGTVVAPCGTMGANRAGASCSPWTARCRSWTWCRSPDHELSLGEIARGAGWPSRPPTGCCGRSSCGGSWPAIRRAAATAPGSRTSAGSTAVRWCIARCRTWPSDPARRPTSGRWWVRWSSTSTVRTRRRRFAGSWAWANGSRPTARGWGRPSWRNVHRDAVERILPEHLEALTPHTITDRRAFLAHLAEVRRRGYALDDEEFMEGVRCVAVPIMGPGRRGRRGRVDLRPGIPHHRRRRPVGNGAAARGHGGDRTATRIRATGGEHRARPRARARRGGDGRGGSAG